MNTEMENQGWKADKSAMRTINRRLRPLDRLQTMHIPSGGWHVLFGSDTWYTISTVYRINGDSRPSNRESTCQHDSGEIYRRRVGRRCRGSRKGCPGRHDKRTSAG